MAQDATGAAREEEIAMAMATAKTTGEALPTTQEVGRLSGKTGLGLLLLLLAVGAPMLFPLLPDSIDVLVTMAQPWLLTAGVGFVGVGGIAKLRKLAKLLHELGDRLNRSLPTEE